MKNIIPYKIIHCIPPTTRKDKRERKHFNRFMDRAIGSLYRNRKARNAMKMEDRRRNREVIEIMKFLKNQSPDPYPIIIENDTTQEESL